MLEAFGARGTRWQWKKQAWRQALEDRLAAAGEAARKGGPAARVCPACRTLAEPGQASCPACGAPLRPSRREGRGTLASLLPAHARASTLLITINVGIMALILATRGVGEGGGLLGILSPPVLALYDFGAKTSAAVLRGGEFWRLITAMYLHGGLIHLLFNGMALSSLGPLIEEAFGARKMFAIYTVTGVAGFLGSTLVMPHSRIPTVGASGAIFGLLGFAFVYGRFRGGPAGRAVAEHLLRWILYGVFMIFIPGIDHAAHAGGLLAGCALGAWMEPGEPRTVAGERILKVVHALMLLATAASFALMLYCQTVPAD